MNCICNYLYYQITSRPFLHAKSSKFFACGEPNCLLLICLNCEQWIVFLSVSETIFITRLRLGLSFMQNPQNFSPAASLCAITTFKMPSKLKLGGFSGWIAGEKNLWDEHYIISTFQCSFPEFWTAGSFFIVNFIFNFLDIQFNTIWFSPQLK